MSGEAEPRGSTAPLDFTEQEVAELAGRRAKEPAAVKRLRKLVPSGPLGRLVSDAAGPARIAESELAAMRRAGRRGERILARLTPSDEPAELYDGPRDDRRLGPDRNPPE